MQMIRNGNSIVPGSANFGGNSICNISVFGFDATWLLLIVAFAVVGRIVGIIISSTQCLILHIYCLSLYSILYRPWILLILIM